MVDAKTEVSQEPAKETTAQKTHPRIYWKMDLALFSQIWSANDKDAADDKNFKQIRTLFCILQNITARNNSLAATYAVIEEEANVSLDTVVRIMHRLLKKDFLVRKHNGLYIVNPYILMRGRDYIRLPALYRVYSKVKEENQPKEQGEQGEPQKPEKQGGQGEPEKPKEQNEQPKQSEQNAHDTAADSLADSLAQEMEKPAKQKKKPPDEEHAARAFWKIDISRFSRIWYSGRSKKGKNRPVKQEFKQLVVLAYILQHIVPSDNTVRVTYQEISDDTGVSKDVVLHIMRRLQARDFLQKKRNGLYVVNPYFLMMGNDKDRLPALYSNYAYTRSRNRGRAAEENRMEKERAISGTAKRGRKRKSSMAFSGIIVDSPSDDELFYWENVDMIDEFSGAYDGEEEEMSMEEMDQLEEYLIEQAQAGYDTGIPEGLDWLVAAEAAAIEAEMAAESESSGG